MKGWTVYSLLAVVSAVATVAECILLGVWALSGLPEDRRPTVWLLVTLVGVSGFLLGYAVLGWRLWCSGDRTDADRPAVALAEDVVHSAEWCKVPQTTNLGGMAIALTAIRQLTWRAELIKEQMHLYLTEWAREGVLDVGARRVTVMFHVMACRILIKMQLESDSHLEGLMGKHPKLREFRQEIGEIVNEFGRTVVRCLLNARFKTDEADAQAQIDAADQVDGLLRRAQKLESDIETWKDSMYVASRDLRAKLLGRAVAEGAA